MGVKIGNLMTKCSKTRLLLRLGPYERWQVDCVVNLLKRHDERVAAATAEARRAGEGGGVGSPGG